jgi:hypothetical protein
MNPYVLQYHRSKEKERELSVTGTESFLDEVLPSMKSDTQGYVEDDINENDTVAKVEQKPVDNTILGLSPAKFTIASIIVAGIVFSAIVVIKNLKK